MFNVTNTRRVGLISAIYAAMASPQMMDYQKLASEFVDSGRGKDKGHGFIKSVALASRNVNSKKPHQGAKECARRVSQRLAA